MNTFMNKKYICDCGGVMENKKITKEITLAGQKIMLENVDAKVCQKCGEIYLDGKMLLALEAELEKDVFEVA